MPVCKPSIGDTVGPYHTRTPPCRKRLPELAVPVSRNSAPEFHDRDLDFAGTARLTGEVGRRRDVISPRHGPGERSGGGTRVAMGDPSVRRRVTWPLSLRVGRD